MTLEHENIVVGSSLCALLYAFSHNYPVFFAEAQRPFRFDHLDRHIDLSCLKIPTCQQSLTTFEGVKLVGHPKEILWERLLFLLSLDGKVSLSNLCHTLRYTGEALICSNEYSKIAEVQFKNCFYFGEDNSEGLVIQKEVADPSYVCYDWIGFNRGGKHEIDYIKTDDHLVNEVWFYSSDRIDGATPVKDACVVSILSEEDLLSFDYSQTMARFKLIHEMESRGMKGLFNGHGPNGKPKYYKFRTSSIARERHKQTVTSEPSAANITIAPESEEALLKDLPAACMAYDRFLRHL
jgi:hypothetical protein